MMAQLLIVEDDAAIAQGLRDNLEFEGHHVTHAADGAVARGLLTPGKFDLVILDLMLPKISGYELLRHIRGQEPELPVLLLTARGDETDRVLGLDLGADDYVAKPFSVRELMARIRALLRRASFRLRDEARRSDCAHEDRRRPYRKPEEVVCPV